MHREHSFDLYGICSAAVTTGSQTTTLAQSDDPLPSSSRRRSIQPVNLLSHQEICQRLPTRLNTAKPPEPVQLRVSHYGWRHTSNIQGETRNGSTAAPSAATVILVLLGSCELAICVLFLGGWRDGFSRNLCCFAAFQHTNRGVRDSQKHGLACRGRWKEPLRGGTTRHAVH